VTPAWPYLLLLGKVFVSSDKFNASLRVAILWHCQQLSKKFHDADYRYAALKDRKSRVARSKSSAVLGFDASREEDDDDANDGNDEPTPFTSR